MPRDAIDVQSGTIDEAAHPAAAQRGLDHVIAAVTKGLRASLDLAGLGLGDARKGAAVESTAAEAAVNLRMVGGGADHHQFAAPVEGQAACHAVGPQGGVAVPGEPGF